MVTKKFDWKVYCSGLIYINCDHGVGVETIVLRCNKFNPGSTDIFEFQVIDSELLGASVPKSQECLTKNMK